MVALDSGRPQRYVTTMFVRFRERKNDGREPEQVEASIACAHPGQCGLGKERRRVGWGRTSGGCPMKPRCPWRIGPGLVPYRLLVSLVENKRVDGKVQQEHIADLGAIDGYWLSAFYADIDPTIAATLQHEGWRRASVWQRHAFWQGVDDALHRLGDRLDAEQLSQIKASIDARIPMLTSTEHDAIPQWETEEKLQQWHRMHQGYADLIEDAKKDMAHHEERLAVLREVLPEMEEYVGEITELVQRVERDGPDDYEQLFRVTHLSLVRILADRAKSELTEGEIDRIIDKVLDEE